MKMNLIWQASLKDKFGRCFETTIGNQTIYKIERGRATIYFKLKKENEPIDFEINIEYLSDEDIEKLFIKANLLSFIEHDKNINIVLNALGLRLATLNEDDREDEPLNEEQTKEHKELKSFFNNLGIEPDFDDDGVVFYVK